MKKLILILFALMFSVTCFAQEASPVVLDSEAQNFVLGLLTTLIVKYPWVATAVAIMGSMRLWAKPVFSAIHTITQITPTKWDDGLWAKCYRFFTETKTGRLISYLLDWFGSIKIQPPAPAPKPTVTP